MKEQIFPCLWFDGHAKNAADFYCGIFENSSILVDTPMVVTFQLNGKRLMGLNGGPMFKINPSISMFVDCSSTAECKRLWDKLSDGGKILMPLDKYPWSEQYGWLQDKFGFSWQIMKSDKDKMVPALLFTGEQIGKAGEAMDFYARVFENSAVGIKNYHPDGTDFAGYISYAEFRVLDYPLIAMDGPGGHEFSFSEAVSLVVMCSSQKVIDYYWNELISYGGKESMCGWCKDKYGLSWQIVPENMSELIGNPVNGQRAMQVMMKMRKLDIEALKNA